MYITLTEVEQIEEAQIRDKYMPTIKDLSAQIRALWGHPDKEAERKALLLDQVTVTEKWNVEQAAFRDRIQRERFRQIEKGGAAAIIANAKEQTPLLLEALHADIVRLIQNATPDEIVASGVGTSKGDKFFLNANYATSELKAELRLHIDALVNDKDHLLELMEVIVEGVENSDLTDSAEITDEEQKPLNVGRFRRDPLGNLTSFGLMNDKINAQLLQDGDIFQQQANGQLTLRWAVNQAPAKQEPVPTYIALTYDDAEIRTTKNLTAYDKQVYEAISTRFWNWQQYNPQKPLYITPQEIWRTMNGKDISDSSANPSDAAIERIRKSVDKMRHIDCYMDVSEEVKAGYLEIDDERYIGGYVKDYLLNCSEAGFYSEKGNLSNGYRVNYEPVLYTYNRAKKHILYAPYEMLDTSKFTSDVENVAEFKGYLLQQILLMKNAKDEKKSERHGRPFVRSNTILLDTIYRETGILPPEKRIEGRSFNTDQSRQAKIRGLRKADRGKIEGLLNAWTAKGLIKGYVALNQNNQPLKGTQQAKGYRIDL